jgi:catechol 2,3-dioxygenase-like lactoylglutathione lyase family enzyme
MADVTTEDVVLLGLHHVALPFPGTAEAVASAREFYAGVIGLKELDVPASVIGVLWFGAGHNTELHLFTAPPLSGPQTTRHPCLRVTGIDALVRRLGDTGADVVVPPGPDIPGRRRFFVIDPFGNVVEFAEFDVAPG